MVFLANREQGCGWLTTSPAPACFAAATFIDRFLLHVLPTGFKCIRHYGILGPAAKATNLAQVRVALSVPPIDPLIVESVADFMRRVERHDWTRCRRCGRGNCVPTAPLAPLSARMPPLRGPP